MLLLGHPVCLCISVHCAVFEERLLRVVHQESILKRAVAEDKALLRSNLSAAAVHWHGDVAAVVCGVAFSLPCYWPKAINLRGPGTASPVIAKMQWTKR